jgi:hypothetical protein
MARQKDVHTARNDRIRRTFTSWFKKEAVALLKEGRSATDAAHPPLHYGRGHAPRKERHPPAAREPLAAFPRPESAVVADATALARTTDFFVR